MHIYVVYILSPLSCQKDFPSADEDFLDFCFVCLSCSDLESSWGCRALRALIYLKQNKKKSYKSENK